jgi:hypothetical protein
MGRFFCDQKTCYRVNFAERLSSLAAHYARKNERLDDWFTHSSFALGGEAGSRLLKDLGVMVPADTLLNYILLLFVAASAPPNAEGIEHRP